MFEKTKDWNLVGLIRESEQSKILLEFRSKL